MIMQCLTDDNVNSVVDRVMNGIINDIITDKYRPGDKLPTETELSQRYDAGRNSVREAVKILQAYGVLYIKRADGTYVSENYNQRMLDPMLYSIILRKNSRDDFVGLRSMIDIGVLSVVVQRRDVTEYLPGIYLTFGELSAELHCENADLERVVELDNRFHQKIAEASRNPMICTMAEYINRITMPSRLETTRNALSDKNNIDNFIELHREILNVIESRKTEDIVRVVNEHYIYWK